MDQEKVARELLAVARELVGSTRELTAANQVSIFEKAVLKHLSGREIDWYNVQQSAKMLSKWIERKPGDAEDAGYGDRSVQYLSEAVSLMDGLISRQDLVLKKLEDAGVYF